MIANTLSNKKPNRIVTESFVRSRKLNIAVFYYYENSEGMRGSKNYT